MTKPVKNNPRNTLFLRKYLHAGIKQFVNKVWTRIRFWLLALMRPITTFRRHRALEGKTVIVYTMGKTGSATVSHTLMKSFPFRRIFHNHFLSREWLVDRLPGTAFARNIQLARPAFRCIEKDSQEILYICMMRDPIARDLSNVIQNYIPSEIDIHNAPLNDVIQRIDGGGHMFFEDWFNTDFAGHIGQSILSFPFDPAQGYSIHRIDHRRRLLLLKLEALDKVFDAAVSEFLGVDIDPQFRFNESSAKDEAAFYELLKKSYRLPVQKLEQIYGSEIIRHFYDEAERKGLVQKWAKK